MILVWTDRLKAAKYIPVGGRVCGMRIRNERPELILLTEEEMSVIVKDKDLGQRYINYMRSTLEHNKSIDKVIVIE